ncbi:hypothetical protein ACO0LC_29060, partial [Undibacterium sp. JH2W]|uniref:hypothetical protein n=1 Tax=Undibacterium sp. JH2W TaxID=3413037 RepID=UPI003BF448DD
APIQVSPLLPAIPGYIFFSVSLFLLIVYFNKQECPKKSGYLTPIEAPNNVVFHVKKSPRNRVENVLNPTDSALNYCDSILKKFGGFLLPIAISFLDFRLYKRLLIQIL